MKRHMKRHVSLATRVFRQRLAEKKPYSVNNYNVSEVQTTVQPVAKRREEERERALASTDE